MGEAIADVAVLEEVLRMILEIINSCLVAQIKSNPNLIYTLLYKKDLFQPFMTSPAFQDLSQNLHTVSLHDFSTNFSQGKLALKSDSLNVCSFCNDLLIHPR